MNTDISYLNGVYHGDGYCSEQTVGLKAKDKDFVIFYDESGLQGRFLHQPK